MRDLAEHIKAKAIPGQDDNDARYAEQQLDLWPDTHRGIPNALARSALFGVRVPGDERELFENKLIASVGHTAEIYYSGRELDQRDLDVWMAVLQLFRDSNISSRITVRSIDLVRECGLTNTGAAHDAVRDRLKRLAFTQLDIRPKSQQSLAAYFGPLLQEAARTSDGKFWSLQLSPRIKALFDNDTTWLEWNVRRRLKRKTLAQNLHMYFRSHKDPFPITIERLHEITDSGTAMGPAFRQAVKRAMTAVQEACAAEGVGIEWSYVKKGDKIDAKWTTRP